MAAKLLHSLADDNPDLQKQIGCMTGIFQLFDRHHMVSSRRLGHRRFPSGTSNSIDDSSEGESTNAYHSHAATDMSRSFGEKRRLSTESSRASFSSSCSSSLSSLDYNRTVQQDASSFDRIVFPETPLRDSVMNQSITSPRLGRQGLDLRDVVKDSMYREARGLSVKTKRREEVLGRAVQYRDSPRPLQFSKSGDESYGAVTNGKQNVPAEIKESLRVLAKLREAPWYYNNETRELPRSSYENGLWTSTAKDTRRFSYDGRETNRLSFESRETIKSAGKLKDSPRLSLDSRERSMRSSSYISKNSQNGVHFNGVVPNPPQSFGSNKRSPNVVAKLMGLEALPDSSVASDSRSGSARTSSVKDDGFFSRPLVANNLNRSIRIGSSPRSTGKEPSSPRWKNSDIVMKPISSSRVPIEPAPWKQADGGRGSQKQASKPAKASKRATNSFPSVYSEIENKIKDLEFKQSGKDLRALKQILEAMQAKGLLEKEGPAISCANHRDYEPKCASPSNSMRSQRRNQNNNMAVSTIMDSDSVRTYESPIVIMKPAKLVEKAGIPASAVIPLDGMSSLHKTRSGGSADRKTNSLSSPTAKDPSPKNNYNSRAVSSTDKRAASRNTKSAQSLAKPPKESTSTSVKNSGSVSPRLQKKKLEFDKRSRPPTPPSDANKPRRQSNSGSPGGRNRAKSHNLQPSDDQLSQISNDSRTSSQQGDDISLQSDSNTVLEYKSDIEATSNERSNEIDDSQSRSMNTVKQSAPVITEKKLTPRLMEDESPREIPFIAPEHPSPVSVLDGLVYRDDAPSPVKQIPSMPGDLSDSHSEDQWNTGCISNSIASGLTSEINRKKLQNVETLVQKLRRLNSSHDEARTDYIASLCENTNPDHRYISEMLLASGLLLRDLSSGSMAFQLHPSGHPINPELFLVLEQTKASSLLSKEESSPRKLSLSKPNIEKYHRKLIFDAVNEILVRKLSIMEISPEPWIRTSKLAKKTLNAQKLLKELCLEIEQLQAWKSECSLDDEDSLKSVLWEDVMNRSGSWTDFQNDIPGVVLDIERLVFKDLVDEIVRGEAAGLKAKHTRRRQVFAK